MVASSQSIASAIQRQRAISENTEASSSEHKSNQVFQPTDNATHQQAVSEAGQGDALTPQSTLRADVELTETGPGLSRVVDGGRDSPVIETAC